MRQIKKVIIHHSATKDGIAKDFDAFREYHIKTRGWKDIGYHRVVEKYKDAFVSFVGRPESEVGVHCTGQNNGSLALCFAGNYNLSEPPQEMLELGAEIVADWIAKYGELEIDPHSKYAETDCPGKLFPMDRFRELVAKKAVPQWKEDAVQWGMATGILDQYKNPNDPVDWGSFMEVRRKEWVRDSKRNFQRS